MRFRALLPVTEACLVHPLRRNASPIVLLRRDLEPTPDGDAQKEDDQNRYCRRDQALPCLAVSVTRRAAPGGRTVEERWDGHARPTV